MLTLCFFDPLLSQPVTVQNTGHVTLVAKVQVPVSVTPAGPENAARLSWVSHLTVCIVTSCVEAAVPWSSDLLDY